MEKTKLEYATFKGPVCNENCEDFYASISDFEDHYEEYPDDKPKIIIPCNVQKFEGLNVEAILDDALEEHYPDAMDEMNDVEELEEFVKKWNAKQTMQSWFPMDDKIIEVK